MGCKFNTQMGHREYTEAANRCEVCWVQLVHSNWIFHWFRIVQIVLERFSRPWLHNKWIFPLTQLGREHRRCLKTLHSFTDYGIRNRRIMFQEMYRDSKLFDMRGSNSMNNLFVYSILNFDLMWRDEAIVPWPATGSCGSWCSADRSGHSGWSGDLHVWGNFRLSKRVQVTLNLNTGPWHDCIGYQLVPLLHGVLSWTTSNTLINHWISN